MTHRLTYAELIALGPCDPESRKDLYGRRKYLTFPLALGAGASISDLLWVAGKLGMKRECVQFALACAQRQAHNNPDPRVKAALDATQAWLDAPSESTENAARSAESAAWNAARSATVNPAWNAESAARNAARSATVNPAWNAESAARNAAASAEREAQKAIFLEIFK